ncbi:MAG TPA: VCBS repeat-containing protein, partial [Oceanospirillales bacterium]|nr:VCBS repeat-containing protein [Oceanospirillales bacterium]
NYVDWSIANNPKCFNASSKGDYCGPDSFKGLKDTFYLNHKGQDLIDKTADYFNNMPAMPGLNVVCVDVNQDGWNDFVIANDGKENLLWLNQKGKSFKQAGLFSGLAVNAQGVAEASMGMALADYDLDGDMDVFFTHLMNESNTLYQNNGKGFFRDISNRAKLSRDSFAYTGWATGFIHVNDDIYPDLLVFNGAVADASKKNDGMAALQQSNQLYLNSKAGTFTTISDEAWLQQKYISRGAAFADLDNDGDVDVLVNNNNDRAQLLLNNQNPIKWQGIKLVLATPQNISIELIGDKQTMLLNPHNDGSYASAHDNRLVFNQAQLAHFKQLRISNAEKVLLLQPLTATNSYQNMYIK